MQKDFFKNIQPFLSYSNLKSWPSKGSTHSELYVHYPLAYPCFNLGLHDITTLLLPFPAELRYCWTTLRPCPRLPSLPLKSSPQTMSATSSSGPPQGMAVTKALFSLKLWCVHFCLRSFVPKMWHVFIKQCRGVASNEILGGPDRYIFIYLPGGQINEP